MAELPPTPTPVLTTEQEQIGTITVLVFSAFAILVVLLAVFWMVRRGKSV
jgi:hypothetical protein